MAAAVRDAWLTAYETRVLNNQIAEAITTWRVEQVGAAPLALLALQPPDWITYEGMVGRVAIDALVMRWLTDLPSDWRAAVSYHPGHHLPIEFENALIDQFPNLVALPERLRQAHSDWLVPHIDAVITVSSTVGMTALLAGKRLIASPASNLARFSRAEVAEIAYANPLQQSERIALLFFLTNQYCHPGEDLLSRSGYLSSVLANYTRQKSYEGYERMFASDYWSPERCRQMLGDIE